MTVTNMAEISLLQAMTKIRQLAPQWNYREYSHGNRRRYEGIKSITNSDEGEITMEINVEYLWRDRGYSGSRISFSISCNDRLLFVGGYHSENDPEEYQLLDDYLKPYFIAQRERESENLNPEDPNLKS